MPKVEFTYDRGGKKVMMEKRFAETLRKLGHGDYAEKVAGGYKTRMLEAGPPTELPHPEDELLISQAVAHFAEENGVDLSTVTGTGKDGRVKKSDVEAVIAARGK